MCASPDGVLPTPISAARTRQKLCLFHAKCVSVWCATRHAWLSLSARVKAGVSKGPHFPFVSPAPLRPRPAPALAVAPEARRVPAVPRLAVPRRPALELLRSAQRRPSFRRGARRPITRPLRDARPRRARRPRAGASPRPAAESAVAGDVRTSHCRGQDMHSLGVKQCGSRLVWWALRTTSYNVGSHLPTWSSKRPRKML